MIVILKQTSLRESYVQIIISMLRTALLNVYPIELMINIIQNFGLMDPIIDESVKLIFYQNLKEKIKRTKEIKVFESTLKFMEDVVYESYKKSMVDEDKFHGTLSLTKLIATTLRNIGKHTTLTSKNVAKTHQVFIREVIKVMKGENKDKEGEVEGVEGENKTKEDLEKLKLKVLKTYRLLSLVVKSILVPLHARELMKQTKTSMEIYNPKESIPDWLPYFNYIKVLDEAAGPIREKEQVDEGEQSKLSAVEGPTTRVLEQTPGNTTQLLDTIFESEEVGDVE
ncbi:hypothetical protein K502DRAFT_26231 [Neoconidiobolus thromboides FSU 785]|nr:hypothetical protein K502DRAFT_26231 [Neoconidiobolus thromboides FSU 785]